MKKRAAIFCILLPFLAEILVLLIYMGSENDTVQDTIAVNEIIQTVEAGWTEHALEETQLSQNNTSPAGRLSAPENTAKHIPPLSGTFISSSAGKKLNQPDYTVLDNYGHVLFKTSDHISESIHEAVRHRDTVLDISPNGKTVGKLIIYNSASQLSEAQKLAAVRIFAALLLIQALILAVYAVFFERIFIKPFRNLESFAQRIAGGNLDIPLAMDRKNIFGAFTESFDLMRTELKRAKIAEAKANAEKKELVAKLSHDIKTPAASIKAASELGLALSESDRMKDNYTQIIRKADQINTLVTDLFTATLKELQQLPVEPSELESSVLYLLLENADYLHRAEIPDIPDILLYADKLRLQQVIDNIFANSYKYADTRILVSVYKEHSRFLLEIEDFGGGVPSDEVLLLKEKFRRGSNAKNIEGAGLGLYISDYFMKEMDGELDVENGTNGLKISVSIALAGYH